MSDNPLLLGVWRYLLPVPSVLWNGKVSANGRNMAAELAFMTPDHHRVRNYAVLELPRRARPLEPEDFAGALDLPLDRVVEILDELEAHLTFVYRTNGRAVDWAYPVSTGPTPHHVAFSTGERIDAA
jgi:hypothetical protein